jgi:hypothetical protein
VAGYRVSAGSGGHFRDNVSQRLYRRAMVIVDGGAWVC